jgi:tetratricopeptide (TPR) repeat protein
MKNQARPERAQNEPGAHMKQAIGCLVLSLVMAGCAADSSHVANVPPPPPDDAIKNVPVSADTRYAAAQLAEAKGDFVDAIAQYKAALKQNPKHLSALYALGCLQVQVRDYPAAVETWMHYVKATDGSAIAYCDLAYAEEWAGRHVAADADYQRAIKKDPKNENCRVNYGMMQARAGNMAEAAKQLGVVLPEAEVHYDLAAVYAARGNKLQARLEYQKALDLDPDLTDAKAKLASLDRN